VTTRASLSLADLLELERRGRPLRRRCVVVWDKAAARACRRRHYEEHRSEYIERAKRSTQEARIRIREFIDEYKRRHPCGDCGEGDPDLLEFHHVGTKADAVANLARRVVSIARVAAEIEKCITLCANCHRKRHAIERSERGWVSPPKRGNERQTELFEE